MKKFQELIQKRANELFATGVLFISNLTGQQVWDLYLAGFKPEHNPKFRSPESSTHNCNLCNNFIRRYGNIVAIGPDNKLMTIWDVNCDEEYKNSAKPIEIALKESSIKDIFFETYNELNSLPYESCNKTQELYLLGIPSNKKRYTKEEAEMYGVVKPNEIRTFNHLYLDIPTAFVDKSNKPIKAIQADYRSNKEVLGRMLIEVHESTLQLMIDLIKQDSLLSSGQYIKILKDFIDIKKEYNNSPNKEYYLWLKSIELKGASKFYNSLQGQFLKEITEGVDLNKACLEYNKRIDPINYGKAQKAFTPAMKKALIKSLEELGITEESFIRRHMTISDIDVNEIKYVNIGDSKIKEASLFDKLGTTSHSKHKRAEFNKVEEVTIDKFMNEILPDCKSVEAFLENRMESNLCNLTTAIDKDNANIFKYNNLASKTFNGNLAGKSELTQMVEAKGGRIDGVFRFTHSWNKLEPNQSLMDLHVFMPDCVIPKQWHHGPNVIGRRVGWNNRTDNISGGNQDVDYTSQAPTGYIPVENITFPTLSKMPEGKYTCAINNWSFRNSGGKGEAEIAFEGNTYHYIYPATKNDEWIIVAEITLKNGKFTIEHKLPCLEDSKELYDLETNKFHKVNLVCLSPNYWGTNNVGIKHYMFMLEDCKTDKSIVGFHTEDLLPELAKNNAGMRDLASITMIEPENKQLAGLGFNASVRDELLVRVTRSSKTVLKIKF